MSRRNIAFSAIGALALLALLVWAFAPRPVEVELAEATVGPFETTIDEDARTRLHDRYVISAPLAGRLQRLTLREGDVVEPGSLVAVLIPSLSPMLDERSLRQQQARVGAAEAGLRRSDAQVAAARVDQERAAVDLQRTEQLARQGFVAPTKIDADRLAALAAQKSLDSAVESRHVARHDLEQARAALATVRGGSAAAGFELRAPVGGRVLKVHLASETTVALGAPIIDIGDTARLEVVAELLTNDALQARPGSAVRIERWGGPTVLQGRVRSVEPAAFTKVSALGVEEQRVNVIIDITSPAAEWAALGDGYRVGVRIVTRSESRVLRLPVSAIFPLPRATPDADGAITTDDRAAVFVFDRGRARLTPVKVAARNGSLAWVREGLAPGAKVIVYPPATVADGTRVAARGD